MAVATMAEGAAITAAEVTVAAAVFAAAMVAGSAADGAAPMPAVAADIGTAIGMDLVGPGGPPTATPMVITITRPMAATMRPITTVIAIERSWPAGQPVGYASVPLLDCHCAFQLKQKR